MFIARELPKPNLSSAPPAFYRLKDVVRITALSRSTIYARITEGKFPRPIHLGGKAAAWASADLQEWIDAPNDYRAPTAKVQESRTAGR